MADPGAGHADPVVARGDPARSGVGSGVAVPGCGSKALASPGGGSRGGMTVAVTTMAMARRCSGGGPSMGSMGLVGISMCFSFFCLSSLIYEDEQSNCLSRSRINRDL